MPRQARIPTTTFGWLLYHGSRPPVLGAGLVAALTSTLAALSYWWPDRVPEAIVVDAALVSSNIFVATIALGLGSWLGVRSRRLGWNEVESLATSSRRIAAALRPISASVTLAVSVLISITINSSVLALTPFNSGWVNPAIGAYCVVSAAASVLVGFLVGRLVPHYLAIPGVAISGWFVSSALHGSRELRMFWPRFYLEATVFDVWNVWLWIGAVAWFFGLLFIIVGVIIATRESRMTVALLCGGLLAVAIGGLLMSTAGFRVNDRSLDRAVDGVAVVGAVCSGEDPAVCLPRSFEGVRPSLQAEFSAVARRLSQTPIDMSTVELRPRGVGSDPARDTLGFAMDSATVAAVPAAIVEFVDGFAIGETCFGAAGAESWAYRSVVYEWLVGQSTPALGVESLGGEDERAHSRFASFTEDERQNWLGEHWESFVSCSLESDDFVDSGSP